MSLGQAKAITDICVLVEDIERTVAFYTEKIGFRLRRRGEGFADFSGAGLTLAAWELDHMSSQTGVSSTRAPANAYKACIAVRLDSPSEVDHFYRELSEKGVPFAGPPGDHVWNARCAYFTDPDGTLWELYAWLEGGPGDYHEVHES